ncbi:PREDICTED: galectin-3-binding protein, partial [Myotis davidii]|uniref:galectin-3-binding protein n=1 Tax=Myotis davidii TaxID=225400 RepID=UPI0007670399
DAPNEGRVEIFYGGQWGTVCDNLWDLVDASVVCRALGFENAIEALGRAAPGTGPIMLDEVQCSGTEPSLANCSSLGWLRSNCRHNQDAGVICMTVAVKADGAEPLSLCAHSLILTSNPEAQALWSEPGSTVTMEVDAECLPVVPDFLRWVSRGGRAHAHTHTHLDLHASPLATRDPTLEELCVQFLAWNFEALTGAEAWPRVPTALLRALLSRSELAVPSELALLTALDAWSREKGAAPGDVEGLVREVRFPMIPPEDLFQLQSNLSLYRSHRALFQEQTLQALEFHTVPLPLLAQLRGLNLSQDAYQPRLYTSPTWSGAVARSSRESSRRSYDSYPYRYGSYPNRYDRYDRYGRYGPTSAPTGYFQTPQHPSFLFRTSRISWTLAYLPTVQSCWNYGFSCSSDEVPALGLSRSGSSDPTIGYENKALMLCGGRFVADVTAFEGVKAAIPNALNANSSRRASFFPCPAGSFSSFRGVIRPFYLTNSSGVE